MTREKGLSWSKDIGLSPNFLANLLIFFHMASSCSMKTEDRGRGVVVQKAVKGKTTVVVVVELDIGYDGERHLPFS